MRALEILDCIMYMDLCGEDLIEIEVPSVDDECTPQNEEWWTNQVGGVPEEMIDAGMYLCIYPDDARDFLQSQLKEYIPDAVVRVNEGETIVYLYKVEE